MSNSARPTSLRSLRPASIAQPSIPAALDLQNVPSELLLVLGLLSLHAQRPYCDGYILRKQVNLPDGKPAPDQEWYEFYAQLNGTILSLWDAEAVDQAADMGDQAVMPQYINVTDAIITKTNSEEYPDHFNVLSICTAGSNRYLLEFQNPNVLKRWSAAFRIATYERAALQECYTAALIARSRAVPNVRRLFSAYHGVLGSKGKYSGWARVRFSWSIKWQRCWVVVSDTPSSWSAGTGQGIHERLLYKFSNKQSLRGEVRFYGSRRDPKNKPIAIFSNVFSAYAVYPEKQFLVDSSTLIKVEGSLQMGRGGTSRSGEQFTDAFVLLVPDDMPALSSNNSSPSSSPVIRPSSSSSAISRNRLSSTSSALLSTLNNSSQKGSSSAAFESMLTWLLAFYDAFSLYGRPDKLVTNGSSPDSMIFAMPSSMEDSYLDVEVVFTTLANGGHLEDNTYSTREWRYKLKELTMGQVKQGTRVFNPAFLFQGSVTEGPAIRPPLPSYLRKEVEPNDVPVRMEPAPTVYLPANPRINVPPYPAPTAQRQPGGPGVLRRKISHPERDSRAQSYSEGAVETTRAAVNRFSLSEDMDDGDPTLPRVARLSSYQPSPLRSSEILSPTTESGLDDQVRVGRPVLYKRESSRRRAQSETRTADLYREAEETKRIYSSDEEADSRPAIARRVSSDEIIKHRSSTFSNFEQAGTSHESLDNETQFSKTFNQHHTKSGMTSERTSGASSDRSETSADPSHYTTRTDGQSSPTSSIESLPPPKLYNVPYRGRRLADDLMYNAGHVPPETTFNAPLLRDQLQPSDLPPGNSLPIPARREPSPSRPLRAQGPRSAPWSAAQGESSRADDILKHNQDMMQPKYHRPAPNPSSKPPPAINYPSYPTEPRPQQFSPESRQPYQQSTPDPQTHPRGPSHQSDQYENPYYPPEPRQPDQPSYARKIVRRPSSNQDHDSDVSQSNQHATHPTSLAQPRPNPPNKLTRAHPQGPRYLASST